MMNGHADTVLAGPDESPKLDPIASILVKLDVLIMRDDTGDALELLLETDTERLIELGCMDFIDWIAGHVLRRPCLYQSNQDRWQCCKSMLEYVVKMGKPKEALLGLLNQLECYTASIVNDVFSFELWLKQIRVVLLQLPVHPDYMKWALSLIAECFSNLPMPTCSNLLDETETAFLQNDPKMDVVVAAIEVITDFVQPFIIEVTQCRKYDPDAKDTQRQILAAFLLSLLEDPLSRLDLRLPKSNAPSTPTSQGHRFDIHEGLERLVSCVYDIYPYGLYGLTGHTQSLSLATTFSRRSLEQEKQQPHRRHVGILCLEYCTACLGLATEHMVCVISPEFWFRTVLGHLAVALEHRRDSAPPPGALENVGEKMLALCEHYLRSCQGQPGRSPCWTRHLLESPSYTHLFDGLLDMATLLELESRRRRAIRCFEAFVDRFDPEGKFALIRYIFQSLDGQPEKDRGVKGFLVDYYRKRLAARPQLPESPDFWQELPTFFGLFVRIPFPVETDLMERFQLIMAVLNLVRYLLLVRNHGNQKPEPDDLKDAAADRVLCQIEPLLLRPMEKALELSKAHYRLERDKLRNEGKGDAVPEGLDSVALLDSALSSLDIVQSVLYRCIELIRNQPS